MNDTGRAVLIAVVALIMLPLLWGAVMMGGMGPGMMGGWYGDGRGEPWRALMGFIPMVVIVAAVVAALVWGLGRSGPPTSTPGATSARDVLDARYARGEITREQYQQMREDLGS